ncbi:hypothetical protein Y032_0137g2025 [Ancylostoma ceylanicum]|uniref:Uncharacterized protein n=1 Tax=Ancylostoma ceylanicum TaxID=53326 RepID=A0A016T485_9BILA|nr:hypothetical protein Y032_0137g2025 [Ancylostoma ceylanicum]
MAMSNDIAYVVTSYEEWQWRKAVVLRQLPSRNHVCAAKVAAKVLLSLANAQAGLGVLRTFRRITCLAHLILLDLAYTAASLIFNF